MNCNAYEEGDIDAVGEVEVALTNAPKDVACLVVEVQGERTNRRPFEVTTGKKQVFRMSGLPVGKVSVTADAFSVDCDDVSSGAQPTWFSEAVAARIRADRVTQISLAMVHNGQATVSVDFDEEHGNSGSEPELEGGSFSSAKAYMVPQADGVRTKAILTAGDQVGTKADGTAYRLVGIPDGLGAFDNGDGTFTLVLNHELGNTSGIERAHGSKGAFLSKWVVRKADLAVLSGSDLIQEVVLWDAATSAYKTPAKGVNFGRFCSADLPLPTALFDDASGDGFDGLLYFNGEETGNEGRALAHGMDGVTYEIPRAGKASWENVVPSPKAGKTTVVASLDDSGGGQVYFYAGTKTNSGSPVERAGLTNGTLYGLRVVGGPTEDPDAGLAAGPFEMYEFGNVENWTGAKLETESNTNLVSKFQRPEDGAWDPSNPDHFYFATTASFATKSRLWRLAFVDASRPELGGSIEMLLDGSEGQRMIDNIAIDKLGHVYLDEDVGSNAHLGRVWRYDIASDALVEVLRADSNLFVSGAPNYLTQDEEASGVVDASDLLGPGWFLSSFQVHRGADSELVEGGQLFAFFDPAAVE